MNAHVDIGLVGVSARLLSAPCRQGTPALPTGDKMGNVTLPYNTVRCSRSWHGPGCLGVLARPK